MAIKHKPLPLHLEIQRHRGNPVGIIRSSFRENGKVKHSTHGRITGLRPKARPQQRHRAADAQPRQQAPRRRAYRRQAWVRGAPAARWTRSKESADSWFQSLASELPEGWTLMATGG